MATSQLLLFPDEKRKHGHNPYRDTDGKFCSKDQSEIAKKDIVIHKQQRQITYLKGKVEMYERAYLALTKRLNNHKK